MSTTNFFSFVGFLINIFEQVILVIVCTMCTVGGIVEKHWFDYRCQNPFIQGFWRYTCCLIAGQLEHWFFYWPRGPNRMQRVGHHWPHYDSQRGCMYCTATKLLRLLTALTLVLFLWNKSLLNSTKAAYQEPSWTVVKDPVGWTRQHVERGGVRGPGSSRAAAGHGGVNAGPGGGLFSPSTGLIEKQIAANKACN